MKVKLSLLFYFLLTLLFIITHFIPNYNKISNLKVLDIILFLSNEIIISITGVLAAIFGYNFRKIIEKEENFDYLYDLNRNYFLIEKLLEKTGELIYIYDVNSGLIEWFGAIEELTGYNKDYFQKFNINDWENMIHKDDKDRVVKSMEYCRLNNLPFKEIYKFRIKNGDYIYIQDEGVFLKDSNDKEIMIGTMSNITPLITANEESKNKMILLQDLIESLPEALLLIDNKETIIMANNNVMYRFGLNNEILGRNYKDVFNEDSDLCKYFTRVMKEKNMVVFESKTNDKYYEECLKPILDSDGNVDKIICISKDITSRKNLEVILEKNQERMSKFLELSPEAIIILDLKGNIIDCNKKCLEIFGYDNLEEVKGTNFITYFQENYKDKSLKYFNILLENNYIKDTDSVLIKKNGDIIYAIITAYGFEDYDGSKKIIGYLRDITENKKLQEKEIQLQKELLLSQKKDSLKLLASGIANDFNNLLMIISGNMSILSNFVNRNTKYYEYVEEINSALKKAEMLTSHLLSYCECANYKLKDIDLSNTIDCIIPLIKTLIPSNIELKVSLKKDLPLISGDIINIQQILVALITNSVEAIGDKKGVIEVSTGIENYNNLLHKKNYNYISKELRNDDYVYLKVVDNGCGIDEDQISKIFDPFYSTKLKGRGLGLASVLGIVNYHKGSIIVKTKKSFGTTFIVLLPMVKKIVSIEEDKLCTEDINSINKINDNFKILVVDDEEGICRVCQVMLKYLGYDSLTTNSGNKALRLIMDNSLNIKIVLLDLTMPDINGIEVLREIKYIDPNIKVILTSGFSEVDIFNNINEVKPDAFLQKPYQIETLKKVINEVLR